LAFLLQGTNLLRQSAQIKQRLFVQKNKNQFFEKFFCNFRPSRYIIYIEAEIIEKFPILEKYKGQANTKF
jgi:hypothetical protein